MLKFLFCLLLLTGCTSYMGLGDIPPVMKPVVAAYPAVIGSDEITLFGVKDKNVDVILNQREFTPINDSTHWSISLKLETGENRFVFYSMDRDGNESKELLVIIERQDVILENLLLSDLMPSVATTSPIDISGTKIAGSAVFLNGKIAVSTDDSTSFTFSYSPVEGENLLNLFQQNSVGNKSATITKSISFNGSIPVLPRLISPLESRELINLLSWDSEMPGETYIVEVSNGVNFTSNITGFPVETGAKNFTVVDQLSDGIYYWRVGVKVGANVFFTPHRSFTVGKALADFNADGFSDILVGAPAKRRNSNSLEWGEAYIYPGSNIVGTESVWKFTGENNGDKLGNSTSWVGDLNGDGFDDFVIGAPGFDFSERDSAQTPTETDPGIAVYDKTGRVYLFFGGETLGDLPNLVFTGENESRMGYDVAGLGDFNGDGFDDLAISAVNGNASKRGEGSGDVFIYYGGIVMDGKADVVISGRKKNDGFGWSIDGAGDVDGDGFMDIVIGAPGSDISGDNSGSAYVYFGSAEGVKDSYLEFVGYEKEDEMGYKVSGAGDINGDGLSDVMVASLRRDLKKFGLVLLYFGSDNLDSVADMEFLAENEFDMFGLNLDALGDINNDGFDDIMIAAPYSDAPGFRMGQIYIYNGAKEPDVFYDVLLNGFSNGELLGKAGGLAGDLDGDGFTDLVLGAPFNDESRGRVVFYFGRSDTMPTIPDDFLINHLPGSLFGESVN